MANIDSTRSSFFPNAKTESSKKSNGAGKTHAIDRNSNAAEGEKSRAANRDSKVDINDAIKDFSKIKLAVDKAPDLDRAARIAELKSSIANGTYEVDYDKLADRMLQSEF